MAPLDPNWKKPEVSPEMVAMVKKIKVPRIPVGYPEYKARNFPNLRAKDGSITHMNPGYFGGIYASNPIKIESEFRYSDELANAWFKAYKEYIPPNYGSHHGNQLQSDPYTMFERDKLKGLLYARHKNIVDTLGPIKVLDEDSTIGTFDNFACKYVDANEHLGPNTYRFKMLNPIYNKVGNWWLGDKGQPIMAVPNNMKSYDGEPVVPKSYDDYLTYTDDAKNLIAKLHEELEHPSLGSDESEKLYLDTCTPTFGAILDAVPDCHNGSTSYGEENTYLRPKDSIGYRDKTPLEFMSPYNPDVLVPEDKLNELAKEHPEVWKPMIFKYKGYKSICVSENGYIISAYQPAPNVFLPIHVYGLSDHRGPYGYDAAKSVIITIHNLVLDRDVNGDILYNKPDASDTPLVDSVMVKESYDDMIKSIKDD